MNRRYLNRTGPGLAWLALLALTSPTAAHAQTCLDESQCTFEKPNVLLVMSYASSTTANEFPATSGTTRWEAQVAAIEALLADADVTDDIRVGLARFAHDPDPLASNTTLGNDTSSPAITDGFAVDVGFDDGVDTYLDCNAMDVATTLAAIPPPPVGTGAVADTMGSWTQGALDAALAYITDVQSRHPGDVDREYRVVLVTDNAWSCADDFDATACDDAGDPKGDQDPAPSAAALLTAGVRVHVVTYGDSLAAPSLASTASMGGTTAVVDATTPAELEDGLAGALQAVREAVVIPECIGKLPRVMIIMDASSSMLVGDAPGATNWDKARYALAGNPDAPDPGDTGYVEPIFDKTIMVGSETVAVEDAVHIGLLAYNLQSTQQLMLQYAPCARDNIQWAMNPYTSCEAPDCTDPYTDPDPIPWTFKDSNVDPVVIGGVTVPAFAQQTTSFMPPCNDGNTVRCLGNTANTFTGEGTQAASDNRGAYASDPGAFNVEAGTPFINILITDGRISAGSVDPVPILEAMVTDGVLTYVIGFGEPGTAQGTLDTAALDAYADAGGTATTDTLPGGGMGPGAVIVDPTMGGSAGTLADAIVDFMGDLTLDPCCRLDDCSVNPEPALPLCGNGVVNTGEACDRGIDNGDYDADGVGGAPSCNATCTADQGPYCGDAVENGSETCDDGADNDTYDHCLADCSGLGPHCGDGNVDDPDEACDDMNSVDDDDCRNDCSGSCGDAEINGDEVCDDGTNDGGYDGCESDCSALGPTCGDANVDAPDEVCDDGLNTGAYGGCAAGCGALGPYCGDGAMNGFETCDDANTTPGDGCSAICQLEAPPVGNAGAGGSAGVSAAGSGGTDGAAGSGAGGDDGLETPQKSSGCGCRVPGTSDSGRGASAWWLALLVAAAVYSRARTRGRRRTA